MARMAQVREKQPFQEPEEHSRGVTEHPHAPTPAPAPASSPQPQPGLPVEETHVSQRKQTQSVSTLAR